MTSGRLAKPPISNPNWLRRTPKALSKVRAKRSGKKPNVKPELIPVPPKSGSGGSGGPPVEAVQPAIPDATCDMPKGPAPGTSQFGLNVGPSEDCHPATLYHKSAPAGQPGT